MNPNAQRARGRAPQAHPTNASSLFALHASTQLSSSSAAPRNCAYESWAFIPGVRLEKSYRTCYRPKSHVCTPRNHTYGGQAEQASAFSCNTNQLDPATLVARSSSLVSHCRKLHWQSTTAQHPRNSHLTRAEPLPFRHVTSFSCTNCSSAVYPVFFDRTFTKMSAQPAGVGFSNRCFTRTTSCSDVEAAQASCSRDSARAMSS